MLLPWQTICEFTSRLPNLKKLSASSNGLQSLSMHAGARDLTSLTLEYNEFRTISDLSPLQSLPALESLYLKGNRISSIGSKLPTFAPKLHYVDLSYNQVVDWAFVDELCTVFPGLSELRFSKNPLYGPLDEDVSANIDDGFMLTLARLGNLKVLNFSKISTQERVNAEMFYLSRIGQELAKVPENQEAIVISRHKRYSELCELHGAPTIARKTNETIDPNFVEARLIKFSFYLPPNTTLLQNEAVVKNKEIPKSFDVYRVKGIVGREFGLRPLSLRLIWETGEIDPIAGYEEEEEEEDSDDEQRLENNDEPVTAEPQNKNKWIKREVELEDGTRPVGNMIDGKEATVRVELRQVYPSILQYSRVPI